ncbi:hypothetical protein Hanom_Chr10g00913661 [Helianthus anomalus]
MMVVQQSWGPDSAPTTVVRLSSDSQHISAQVRLFRLIGARVSFGPVVNQ